MKKKYVMPDSYFNEIAEIARKPSPVMYLSGGVPMGRSTQERANDVWQRMAKELGFIWDSAESAGTGNDKEFLATPVSP